MTDSLLSSGSGQNRAWKQTTYLFSHTFANILKFTHFFQNLKIQTHLTKSSHSFAKNLIFCLNKNICLLMQATMMVAQLLCKVTLKWSNRLRGYLHPQLIYMDAIKGSNLLRTSHCGWMLIIQFNFPLIELFLYLRLYHSFLISCNAFWAGTETKLGINFDWDIYCVFAKSSWKLSFVEIFPSGWKNISKWLKNISKWLKKFQFWFKVERKDADNITTELMLAINVKMKNSRGR